MWTLDSGVQHTTNINWGRSAILSEKGWHSPHVCQLHFPLASGRYVRLIGSTIMATFVAPAVAVPWDQGETGKTLNKKWASRQYLYCLHFFSYCLPICPNKMCMVMIIHILMLPKHMTVVMLCTFWTYNSHPNVCFNLSRKCITWHPSCVWAASIF